MCYFCQYVDDDGTCAKSLTKEKCLGVKTFFDGNMNQCLWRDNISEAMSYDDYFSCQFVQPSLSLKV